MLQAFLKDDSGATTIEYGFIAGLVSIAILAAVMSLGDSVTQAYDQVNDGMAVAAGTPAAETPGDGLALEPVLDPVAIAIQ
ncbi:MAG: Flp family type IVb pilin [Proteobacteria bacterium]|nr:Flp family type IVb pilin [Pseudomonadota bacterium]